MKAWILIGFAVGFVREGTPATQAGVDSVSVQAVRFALGDGTTLVNGFVRVPHQLLSPLTVGASGFAAFRLEVTVADQSGTVLTRGGGTQRVDWSALQVAGGASVEPLSGMALAPGTYTIRASVRDSASGRTQAVQTSVVAFAARPAASDLLLAYGVRRAQPGDTQPAAGEVRKGELFIATSPDVRLSPTHAALAYYCEVYRDSAVALPWRLQVVTPDGRALLSTAPAQTAIGAGGGVLTGSLDLTGLPPGTYRLALLAGAGSDTVSRVGAFQMGGFEAEQHVATATQAAAEPNDPFVRLSETQMDTLESAADLSRGRVGVGRVCLAHGRREATLPARFLAQARPDTRDPRQRTDGGVLQADRGCEHAVSRRRRRFDPRVAHGSGPHFHFVRRARRDAAAAAERRVVSVGDVEVHEKPGAVLSVPGSHAARQLCVDLLE